VECDVCVVGAGYAGRTAAHRLREAGRPVVVLEARDRGGPIDRTITGERPRRAQ
jgi:putrescine oxidase